MNIPWRLKSIIFRLIDVFGAFDFLYFLQRNLTKRSKIKELNISKNWHYHHESLAKHKKSEKVFEFGVGKNLAQNLYLSQFIKQQILVDLFPMIDIDMVETARQQLSKNFQLRSKKNITKVIDLNNYGIKYMAPFDASVTNFSEQSIDACISTNTLEHIPKDSLQKIFIEMFRILKRKGIISMVIDYSDHYAHTDKNISLLNYLKYDSKRWEKYNHKCHFQNRLRHFDYIELFNNCGFTILKEDLFYNEKNIPTELENLYCGKDLSWKATNGHIVMQKP